MGARTIKSREGNRNANLILTFLVLYSSKSGGWKVAGPFFEEESSLASSAAYQAPEFVEGLRSSEGAVDIWSIGSILREYIELIEELPGIVGKWQLDTNFYKLSLPIERKRLLEKTINSSKSVRAFFRPTAAELKAVFRELKASRKVK